MSLNLHRTIRSLLFTFILLWSCGTEKAQNCQLSLDGNLLQTIQSAYARNRLARDQAIAQERKRLGVRPLLLTEIYQDFGSPHTLGQDPFPNSVIVLGKDYDLRKEGYWVNHGKMGATHVYETYPGSQVYFIVDEIGGDGLGGNGSEMVAETVEYQNLSLAQASSSWHSWHVSEDNLLVRAYLKPINDLQGTFHLCGCGSSGYESVSLDIPLPRSLGIFLLPGSKLPVIAPEETFQAEFIREHYKKIYVPSEGKGCKKHEVVC